MILLLLALQAAPADDIVVVGERLAHLSATVRRGDDGRYRCALDGSSGRASLDGALCRVATRCVRDGAADQAAVAACVEQRKPALLADVRRELERRP